MNNSTQGRHWLPQPHPCPRCGRRTIYRLCDICFANDVADAATGPLPPLTQAMLRAEDVRQRRREELAHEQGDRAETLSWLADIGEVGGPLDGDEFADVLRAVRMAREVAPPVRYWSGMCHWCAREIREQSGDEVTHRPPLHLIQTCPRHRRALLGLMAWLRSEKFGKGGAA